MLVFLIDCFVCFLYCCVVILNVFVFTKVRSTKGAGHCFFRRSLQNNYFDKILPIDFISSSSSLQTYFSFADFSTDRRL